MNSPFASPSPGTVPSRPAQPPRSLPEVLPRHVAVIMDGNGRWAAARGLPRLLGHDEGARSVRRAVEFHREIGIEYLTLYAFSTENWGRSAEEVAGLMDLLAGWAESEREDLLEQRVRVHVIGQPERLSVHARASLDETVRVTSRPDPALVLTLALSYGGRSEIARAAAALARAACEGRLDPARLEEEGGEQILALHLDTGGMPDPDLVIRTGGEVRLSNFLLFQSAYSEWIFRPTPWPEFRDEAFLDCFTEFARRRRRFGRNEAPVCPGPKAGAQSLRAG